MATIASQRIIPFVAARSYLDKASGFFLILTGFFIPISITATDICMAAASILCLLSGQLWREVNSLKLNHIVLVALSIMLLVTIAFTWSIAPWADRMSAWHKYAKLFYIPLLLPLGRKIQWRDRTIYAFLIAVTITVIFSYLKAWMGVRFGKYAIYPPGYVFYTHIETSFLVAFGAYLFAYYAWKKPRWRVFCLFWVAVLTYQEFFINDGRTGMVAYALLLVLYLVQCMRWKGLIVGILIALGMAVILYKISPTFQNISNQSVQNIERYQAGEVHTSLGYRLSFFDLSWRLIKERPWFGYGTGSFATAYQQEGGIPGKRILETPHNEYFMVAVEFGVVGLLLLLLLFYCLWKISFHIADDMRYPAQALLVAFMGSCCYNAFLYLTVSGHFFVLFIALFYANYRHCEEQQRRNNVVSTSSRGQSREQVAGAERRL